MASNNKPTQQEVREIGELLTTIKKNLTDAKFSNPHKKAMEVMKKLNEVQQKYKGKSIGLRIEERRVEFIHHDTQICVDYIQEITPVEERDMCFVRKAAEIERFHKSIIHMKKEKEEIMFYSVHLNEYRNASWEEFFNTQVDEWAGIGDVELLDDNIRSWRWGKQKYYRITFTSSNFTAMSRTEFAFGHMIDGLTYVVKKEDFKKHKKELYYRLRDPKQQV